MPASRVNRGASVLQDSKRLEELWVFSEDCRELVEGTWRWKIRWMRCGYGKMSMKHQMLRNCFASLPAIFLAYYHILHLLRGGCMGSLGTVSATWQLEDESTFREIGSLGVSDKRERDRNCQKDCVWLRFCSVNMSPSCLCLSSSLQISALSHFHAVINFCTAQDQGNQISTDTTAPSLATWAKRSLTSEPYILKHF